MAEAAVRLGSVVTPLLPAGNEVVYMPPQSSSSSPSPVLAFFGGDVQVLYNFYMYELFFCFLYADGDYGCYSDIEIINIITIVCVLKYFSFAIIVVS